MGMSAPTCKQCSKVYPEYHTDKEFCSDQCRRDHEDAEKLANKAKMEKKYQVELTGYELYLLSEALDSHVYWQLSDEGYRNDGFVHEPGSDDPDKAEEIVEAETLSERLRDIGKE
jgi:hypothetical protein